jgi:hypothetical protein
MDIDDFMLGVQVLSDAVQRVQDLGHALAF